MRTRTVLDAGEGVLQVVGERVGGGDGLVSGLNLDDAVRIAQRPSSWSRSGFPAGAEIVGAGDVRELDNRVPGRLPHAGRDVDLRRVP